MTGKVGISASFAAVAAVIAIAGCSSGSTGAAGGSTASATSDATSQTGSGSPGTSSSAPSQQSSATAHPTANVVAPVTVPANATSVAFTIPTLTGVKGWGTYTKVGKRVKVYICVEDLSPTAYGTGALAIGSNASGGMHSNLGAVLFPNKYRQTQCTNSILLNGAHLTVHDFIGGSNGTITQTGPSKTLY
jgi:hypothetical protein